MGVKIVGVSGPVDDRNCLRELVVGRHCHCPNFHCHYQRHQNVYPHITRIKYRPLAEHSYSKP